MSIHPETPARSTPSELLKLFRSFTNAHFATCADEFRGGGSESAMKRRYEESAAKEKLFLDALAGLERELAQDWRGQSQANAQAADNWRAEAAKLSEQNAELRAALEDIAKETQTVLIPCSDPQCGDSTWDHHCNERHERERTKSAAGIGHTGNNGQLFHFEELPK